MLNEIGPSGSGIFTGQAISNRLATAIVQEISNLKPKTPSKDEVNKFATYPINDLLMVHGIKITSILNSIYSRLTREYSLKTGFNLSIPSFPNPSCTIKSQATGQLHEVHTDGGDSDYGTGRILHSSTICLNDDYEGGHTQFYLTGTMEKPNIDIDIKLKAGQALIFSADLNYHGITEVTSGSRYSLIQFWRE